MNKEDFMNQKVSEMTVKELQNAIKIKEEATGFKVGDTIKRLEGISSLAPYCDGVITKIDGCKVWVQSNGRLDWFHKDYLLKECLVKVNEPKPITFAEEIKAFPERFERLTSTGWEVVKSSDGVCASGTAKILNDGWNHTIFNDKLLYVEFNQGNTYKEIIRRNELDEPKGKKVISAKVVTPSEYLKECVVEEKVTLSDKMWLHTIQCPNCKKRIGWSGCKEWDAKQFVKDVIKKCEETNSTIEIVKVIKVLAGSRLI